MKTNHLLGISLFSVSSICLAAAGISPFEVEGEYKNVGVILRTIVLDSESRQIAASTVVTMGACSGSVSGIGTLVGSTLQFKPYKPDEGGTACTIIVKFGAKGKTATIEENDCTPYHGASCAWEGQSLRRVR